MKFVARMNYDEDKPSVYINIDADRMEKDESFVYVYRDDHLVSVVDMGALVTCYLSGDGGCNGIR